MPKLNRDRLGGAIYLLPNLMTTGNLFFGFFSIMKALQGQFLWAASAIMLAAVFDVLDGGVARLTGATSEFGIQYDSLCDLVSFGLAPSILMYQVGLHDHGRLGWMMCFIFLACGVLRLARFNVQSSIGKAGGDFTGLPTPMSAGLVCSAVIAVVELQSMIESGSLSAELMPYGVFLSRWENLTWFYMVVAPLLGVLMVSNVSYRSHKSIKIQGLNPFKLLVLVVVSIGLVAIYPEYLGFCLFFVYALSGPLEWVLFGKRAIDDDEIFAASDDDETSLA